MNEAPDMAAECAAYEDMKAASTEAFRDDVKWQMRVERAQIATAPINWIAEWVEDPATELATIYKQIILFYLAPKEIGMRIINLLDNRIREVAEHIVERKS